MLMTWVIADYHPVSLFALRASFATTSGSKTLLTPTAFAVKMALLNASIQRAGLATGRERFPAIRDLRVAIALPDRITVIQSFAKVRRQAEFKDAQKREERTRELEDRGQFPFQSTIAYREFVQFGEPEAGITAGNLLRVALESPTGESPAWLADTLLAINYLGKRGGFLQAVARPTLSDLPDHALPSARFTELTRDTTDFDVRGTLQMLDDCAPHLTFEQADVYSDRRMTLGKDRILRHVALPYHLTRSSRSYSLYERI
jgi:hypothetical protein